MGSTLRAHKKRVLCGRGNEKRVQCPAKCGANFGMWSPMQSQMPATTYTCAALRGDACKNT